MKISISTARARLAELADYVMAAPHRKVFIVQRNRPERLVLTSEDYMKFLEDTAEGVFKAANPPGTKPFSFLEGAIELLVSPEEFERLEAEDKAERIRKAEAPNPDFDED